ncbi:MAG: SRPBCC family protein [Pirellulales bacterium]
MARVHTFVRQQRIDCPRDEVFRFFENPLNLESITPGLLHFRTLTPPPIVMRVGTLIDYRLRLYGVPVRWRTRIEAFDPPTRFVDVQLRGPYRVWRHLHEFSDVDGATLMTDRVEYELPLGPLGELAGALFVRRSLSRIFDFRRDAVDQLFHVKRFA